MLTFNDCLRSNPDFFSLLKEKAQECIDAMKHVEDMNIVPKIFIRVRPDTPIIPVCVSTMHDLVLKGADIQVLQCSHSFLDIHNMAYPVALLVSSPEEPALHYAKMEAYKAASGYWRVKVDGVVHPKLVGLDTEASAVRRAYELFPHGHFLWPEEQVNKTMKSFSECEEANPNFVALVKTLAEQAVSQGENEDHYGYIFISGNHQNVPPVPEFIIVKESRVPALYGNPHTLVAPYYTLNQILRMVTPRKE